jgi:hypothetical protein
VDLDDQLVHAGPQRLFEQLLRDVVAAAELVDGRQPVQHQPQLTGPVQRGTELAGPGVGRSTSGEANPRVAIRAGPSDIWAASSAWSRPGPSGTRGSASASRSRCRMASRWALRPRAWSAADWR